MGEGFRGYIHNLARDIRDGWRGERTIGGIPPQVIEGDKRNFGDRVVYTETPREYYKSMLEAIRSRVPEYDHEETIRTIRRPGGLSLATYGTDVEEARSLRPDECLVVYAHGSLVLKRLNFPTFFSGSKEGQPTNITHGAVDRLLCLDPIDITLGQVSHHDVQMIEDEYQNLNPKPTIDLTKVEEGTLIPTSQEALFIRSKDAGQIARDILKHISGLKGLTMFEPSIISDHDQCGAYKGNFIEVLRAFIQYANKSAEKKGEDRNIPAIELAEGLIMSVDVRLLREGKAVLKFYNYDRFNEHLEGNGLKIGAKAGCVDDRTPYRASTGEGTYLARCAFGYNSQKTDFKFKRPVHVGALEGHAFQNQGHHVSVILLADADKPSDRKLALFLTNGTQMMCGPCAQGYGVQPMGEWKKDPTEEEVMSYTSGALVFMASASEMSTQITKLPNVASLVGSGRMQKQFHGAHDGSHCYSVSGGVTGTVFGDATDIENRTLIRPPADNTTIHGPLVLVTESILQAAGGEKAFLEKIQASNGYSYYAAIAVVDPEHNLGYRFLTQSVRYINEDGKEVVEERDSFNPNRLNPTGPSTDHGDYAYYGFNNCEGDVVLIDPVTNKSERDSAWPWNGRIFPR